MAKKTPKDSTSNDTTSARTNPMDENKKRALAAALGQIEKQFGKGSVMRMGDRVVEPVEAIPTGSLMLDIALGIGGLPKGRVVEIYGPESSGKTTLTLQAIAECQKMGGTAAFIDAEHALDPIYAATLGVNECRHLAAVAHELKLETVLEVHSENELEYVNDNIDIIGVNNRNLGTFITNTANSEYLAPKLPVSITRISESGIKDAQTILRLQLLGFKGFLIGESFMQADNPAQELARLVADIWELYQNPRV